jgi:DNA-binding response OmpR family regulator
MTMLSMFILEGCDKKFENDPSNPEIVITMWGFGYKLGQVDDK